MPHTVIDWFNILGKVLQKLLVFTDCKGRIIRYGDVEITGVDRDGDKNDVQLKIVNKNDIDYQEDQEEFHPEQENQNIIQQTVKV